MSESDDARWSPDQVLEGLRAQERAGRMPSAQVFVHGSVSPADLPSKVDEIVGAAGGAGAVRVGRIHALARSFSVQGSPDVIERITRSRDVRAVLPSTVDDILPKPLNRTDR